MTKQVREINDENLLFYSKVLLKGLILISAGVHVMFHSCSSMECGLLSDSERHNCGRHVSFTIGVNVVIYICGNAVLF